MRALAIPMLLTSFTLFANENNKDCYQTAMSQHDINICSSEKSESADKELNRVYQDIKKKYADNPVFLEKLKISQLAWIKFRDAEIEALFPSEERMHYGSSKPMCQADWLETITKQRLSELKRWLEPVTDGEMCNGSIGEYEMDDF